VLLLGVACTGLVIAGAGRFSAGAGRFSVDAAARLSRLPGFPSTSQRAVTH